MKFDSKVWYRVFRCPKCGKESHVTNICRECPKTPSDEIATRKVFCFIHKKYHYEDEDSQKSPTIHRSLRMIATDMVSRFNPNLGRHERRKIKNLPEDAIVK